MKLIPKAISRAFLSILISEHILATGMVGRNEVTQLSFHFTALNHISKPGDDTYTDGTMGEQPIMLQTSQ